MKELSERQPIFVFGSPRSGTTLLQRFLDSYDDILIWGQQAGFLREFSAAFYKDSPARSRFKGIVPLQEVLRGAFPPSIAWMHWSGWEEWTGLFRDFLAALFLPRGLSGKQFWGFKEVEQMSTPGDRTFEFLRHMYPNAIFVFIIRNPFNVLASRRKAYRIQTRSAFQKVCDEWACQNQAFWQWHRSGKAESFWIVYEDFIKQRGEILKLIGRLGKTLMEKQAALLADPAARNSSFGGDEAFNERWLTLPDHWLVLAFRRLAKLNQTLGYPAPSISLGRRLKGDAVLRVSFLKQGILRIFKRA